MDHQQNPRIALTGHPRVRGVEVGQERERQKIDFATWNEAVAAARDRADRSRLVNGPILPEERKDK